jgi:hypothetical protein
MSNSNRMQPVAQLMAHVWMMIPNRTHVCKVNNHNVHDVKSSLGSSNVRRRSSMVLLQLGITRARSEPSTCFRLPEAAAVYWTADELSSWFTSPELVQLSHSLAFSDSFPLIWDLCFYSLFSCFLSSLAPAAHLVCAPRDSQIFDMSILLCSHAFSHLICPILKIWLNSYLLNCMITSKSSLHSYQSF